MQSTSNRTGSCSIVTIVAAFFPSRSSYLLYTPSKCFSDWDVGGDEPEGGDAAHVEVLAECQFVEGARAHAALGLLVVHAEEDEPSGPRHLDGVPVVQGDRVFRPGAK